MLYLVAVLVGWDADRCLQSDLMTKSRLRNVEKLVFDDRTRLVDGRNNAPVIPTPTPLRLVRGSRIFRRYETRMAIRGATPDSCSPAPCDTTPILPPVLDHPL